MVIPDSNNNTIRDSETHHTYNNQANLAVCNCYNKLVRL